MAPDTAAQHFHDDESFDRLAAKIDTFIETVECGGCGPYSDHCPGCKRSSELRAALAAAIEEVEGWGTYASDYFQEKWDLRGTVDRLRRVLDGT